MTAQTLTVFVGSQVTAAGERDTVARVLRELSSKGEERAVLVFDDATGDQVDVDLREGSRAGSTGSAPEEPERRGPGRPKLGVVGREVTLLPRHWEWLNAQPGGASVALRRLVESARRDSADAERIRRSQEAAFRFMTAVAGNEPGFEEACRALFGGDEEKFDSQVALWPTDVGAYAKRLAGGAFVVGQNVTGSQA